MYVWLVSVTFEKNMLYH